MFVSHKPLSRVRAQSCSSIQTPLRLSIITGMSSRVRISGCKNNGVCVCVCVCTVLIPMGAFVSMALANTTRHLL